MKYLKISARARYEKGVLTLLEPLDIEDGKEVEVSVRASDLIRPGDKADFEEKMEQFKSAAGSMKDVISEDFIDTIYRSRNPSLYDAPSD